MTAADEPRAQADPSAVVPFEFACHRCGHCCSAGNGYVWLADDEIDALAARLELSREAFLATYVTTVVDPNTGMLRPSLREHENGRCQLLEGQNHCRVYSERPEHCRTFPYWKSILSDPSAFERARQICPGIYVRPAEDVRAAAFAALRALYEEVDAFVERSGSVCIGRGVCCRFEEAGHELFATGLEADYALECHPEPPAPEAEGRCPYHVEGRCSARTGRPLGCRTYHCDRRTTSVMAEAHEYFLRKLREIERSVAYPAAYGRFPALLAARSSPPTDALDR